MMESSAHRLRVKEYVLDFRAASPTKKNVKYKVYLYELILLIVNSFLQNK